MLYWLLIGLAAGAIAKMLTPQQEKGGWVSSLIIGIIGSFVGGFISNAIGAGAWFSSTIIGELIVAVGGSFLVLFIYHRFLADKLNLPL